MTPEELVQKINQALPGQLRAAVLYGSAAAADFVPGKSNYNVLLLVDRLGRAELDALSKPASRWARAGNRPPLLFTPEQFAASSDVFAIELLDIRQSRRVLCGDDPLVNVTIQEEHLRLQLERELKTRLLALREGYLLTGGKPRYVADLMTRSLPGFLVLFRAALRLFQKDVPPHKMESLRMLADHIRFDAGPLHTIDALRHRRVKLRDVSPLGLFESYLATIEQITLAVDRHLHPKTGSVSP
jgi:hypothetical protein